MTKREFLDIVFALAPTEANAIMDAFDEYVDSNEPHLIPCSERLPEIGEYVLCMIRQRYRGRFHVCHYVDKNKYINHPYFDWRYNGFPDVVAWMSLPEPYKGVTE